MFVESSESIPDKTPREEGKKPVTCPTCNGSGYVDDPNNPEGISPYPGCGGNGFVYR